MGVRIVYYSVEHLIALDRWHPTYHVPTKQKTRDRHVIHNCLNIKEIVTSIFHCPPHLSRDPQFSQTPATESAFVEAILGFDSNLFIYIYIYISFLRKWCWSDYSNSFMECGWILEVSDIYASFLKKKKFTCQTSEFTTRLLLLQVVPSKTYN